MRYQFLRFPGGKPKVVTFSYDDGVVQDQRLAALFDKYGLKATFNLNSARLGEQREIVVKGIPARHDKIKHADIKHVYAGHEIAAHTLTHPNLRLLEKYTGIVREVEQDRLILLLTDELPILRARLRISQDELARCIGISRQTYSLIENKKQKMTWVTFMAFIAFFQNNAKTKATLIDMGLITNV